MDGEAVAWASVGHRCTVENERTEGEDGRHPQDKAWPKCDTARLGWDHVGLEHAEPCRTARNSKGERQTTTVPGHSYTHLPLRGHSIIKMLRRSSRTS